jgi:hypothetical protein
MSVFQINDSTYSWLDELDPSAQASNTRWESAISKRSTPRKGRKPTKHTGSSTGGHAYGKKHSLYTKDAESVFSHSHSQKLLTFVMKAWTAADKLHTLLFTEHYQCNESKETTDKHVACMEKIRNTNETLEQTWIEDTNGEIYVIVSLHTCQKSKKQNLIYQMI